IFLGPNFWGLLNLEWSLCNKGRNQSPINIDPGTLLYDPLLGNLKIEGNMVVGSLVNNGHDLTFEVDQKSPWSVNISFGPLAYTYRAANLKVHFGSKDERGSEHTIAHRAFVAEIHIFFYNAELYPNFSDSIRAPHGIAALSLLVMVGDTRNLAFEPITHTIKKVTVKGDESRLRNFYLGKLIPQTEQYITYEGSFTQPGCFETVTWIVFNKPVYISRDQIDALRKLKQGGKENLQMSMSDNIRPIMSTNQRTVRTNINFRSGCSMKPGMLYEVNQLYTN
ncbi:carbonic anhydrase-related protein 10-like, partial [Argonauta hians]